jgi:hypothetical protein
MPGFYWEDLVYYDAYVDVHTTTKPWGELRGQIEARRVGS